MTQPAAISTVEARRALARRGAQHLYRHGARQVWLFGSVAMGRRQDARSDLDLSPLRPPVLSPDLKPLLDELRGFRHVFQHSYD